MKPNLSKTASLAKKTSTLLFYFKIPCVCLLLSRDIPFIYTVFIQQLVLVQCVGRSTSRYTSLKCIFVLCNQFFSDC